jgi:hypothetical protein
LYGVEKKIEVQKGFQTKRNFGAEAKIGDEVVIMKDDIMDATEVTVWNETTVVPQERSEGRITLPGSRDQGIHLKSGTLMKRRITTLVVNHQAMTSSLWIAS